MVYPTAPGSGCEPTPLRVRAPVRLLVHAPPATWGWNTVPPAPDASTVVTAQPVVTAGPRMYYAYDRQESDAIWLASHAYKSAPCPVVVPPGSASALFQLFVF